MSEISKVLLCSDSDSSSSSDDEDTTLLFLHVIFPPSESLGPRLNLDDLSEYQWNDCFGNLSY